MTVNGCGYRRAWGGAIDLYIYIYIHIYTLVAVVVYVCPLNFIHECLILLGTCSHVISVIRGMSNLSDWDPQFKSVGYKCTESVIGPSYLGLRTLNFYPCLLVCFGGIQVTQKANFHFMHLL